MKSKLLLILIDLRLCLIRCYLRIKYTFKIIKFSSRKEDRLDKTYKREIKRYWGKYKKRINLNWHKWYSSRNGICDTRYIPETAYYCDVEPYFNSMNFHKAYSDKAFLGHLFPDVQQPFTIAVNKNGTFYNDLYKIVTEEEVINRCLDEESFVIKPTIDSGGGTNIKFFNNAYANDIDKQRILSLLKEYRVNFIIQKIITQHPKLERIHPGSINTIRTMSFLHKNSVHILSSVLRMGINDSRVDNLRAGGISAKINLDGSLSKYAFDKYGNSYTEHPQGVKFSEINIPAYKKILDVIKNEHVRFGYFKLISWDFSVSPDKTPILLEINLMSQGINLHQLSNGPLFGELTDEVLAEIFSETNKRRAKDFLRCL